MYARVVFVAVVCVVLVYVECTYGCESVSIHSRVSVFIRVCTYRYADVYVYTLTSFLFCIALRAMHMCVWT